MSSVVVIGIDVGTTSAKAGAFDAHGRETGATEIAYPLLEPEHGQAVQDVDTVVEATVAAVRGAVAGAHAAGCEFAGLACSTAMHALCGLDVHDRPLTPLITWADQRAAAQAERLRASHPQLHARTGTPLHPMSPLPKLMWLREEQPDVVGRVARWCGLKELVVRRLCGEWACDVSIGSGTGLMDLTRLAWDPEALALAGVREEQLCPLVETTATLALAPGVADELGLDADVPLVVGAGDGPLANLGVGAVRPGVAACSIGTSGALRLVVEEPCVDREGHAFCYALVPRRWILGGAINNGGVVLRWAGEALAPELGEHPEAALLELAATVAPGSDALIMLPYLLSERAPNWSTLPRGAYVGLTRAHRREHLVRAALEGVCQQLALVLASLCEAGNDVNEIRATGGFARSALWRQMLCDALGRPVGFPAGHQGSGFGAALLGLYALGHVDDLDRAAEVVAIEQTLAPDAAAAELYAAMRPTFKTLSDALAGAFRDLRDLDRTAHPQPVTRG
jgi:gluconokinase